MEDFIMTNNTNSNTQTQSDIFSLFGLVDEHAEKKIVEEKARQAEMQEKLDKIVAKSENETPKAPTKPVKKEEEKFTPDENTVIKYFGIDIPITQYFTPEELVEGLLVKKADGETERKELEPEMLRKRMEKDYLELVKKFTAIIFLKKQNVIVVTMEARKKGLCSESYVLSSDSTSLSFPKIPSLVLNEFISLAKFYGKHNLEVHGDIYYCTEKKEYFLDIPKQSIHRYWVDVTEDAYSIVQRIKYAVKIMEIHSHHTMVPVPSAQDNESERVPGMYYAIVGHTNNFFPNVFLRQFISESLNHRILPLTDMFECPFERLPQFDIESIEVHTNEY